jgi:hypothetical protein
VVDGGELRVDAKRQVIRWEVVGAEIGVHEV